MRKARTVNSWIRAWGLALYLIGIFHLFSAQAQQETLTNRANQGDATQDHHKHHHYKLIDLTFGGPASGFSNGFDGILNSRGTAVGFSETPILDPPNSNPFPCGPGQHIYHAFEWRNGVLADLGTLPGGNCSSAQWINTRDEIVGNSEIGEIDPLLGFREIRAVLWKDGQIMDLGTFGGTESAANSINNRGQVVGFALNATPDPLSMFDFQIFGSPNGTQTRAFLWQNGQMQDLGTLGGPDAMAFLVNERSQITGQSYTNSTPNPVTGIPTLDPFLWQDGTMQDLGSLGGTLGNPTAFNNRGQVVGVSNLAGDLTSHPFLWTKSRGMQDLGTLGGDTGVTNWINDAGVVAGKADLPGPRPQNHDAVLWQNNAIVDLGALPGDSCANAYYVNARGQVVGASESRALCLIPVGEHAFLWENGGSMVDLNTLIPSGSSLQLTYAVAVNDRGEIAGFGVPAGCAPQDVDLCGHAYVLIPCDENHPGAEDCDNSMVEASIVSKSGTTRDLPGSTQRPRQSRRTSRYQMHGLHSPSRSFVEVAPEG
jgi:probable HAF family extracellular repeat protein